METQKSLQFYASKEGVYQNKLFSFRIKNFNDCFRILLSFYYAGNKFRACYYCTFNQSELHGEKSYLRLLNHEEFFKNYNISHKPTLKEAINDFLMLFIET